MNNKNMFESDFKTVEITFVMSKISLKNLVFLGVKLKPSFGFEGSNPFLRVILIRFENLFETQTFNWVLKLRVDLNLTKLILTISKSLSNML